MELTLLWAALTGVAFAWLMLRFPPVRRRLPEDLERPLDLLIVAAAAGMLVGRLAAMLATGVNPITNPLDIIIVRGGVDTGVAALTAIAVLVVMNRSHLPDAVDALAPAAVAGLAGWHAGCLWRSACLGTPSDLPWAWAAEGSDVTRHPVEVYAALLLLAAAIALTFLPWQPWRWSGWALASAGAVRLMTEPLRPSLTGGPIGWYLAGAIVGVVVAVAGPLTWRARMASASDGSPAPPP